MADENANAVHMTEKTKSQGDNGQAGGRLKRAF